MLKVQRPPVEGTGEWFRREVLPRLTVELVYGGDGVKWRRAGKWRARPCPLHGGDGPNLHVDPSTLGWKCHSTCQEGGDAVAYVQRLHGLDFPGAVAFLAALVGEEVPGARSGPRGASRRAARPSPPPRPPARQERPVEAPARPPRAEVEALWNASTPLHLAAPRSPAAAFLAGRGWTAAELEALAGADMARLTPTPGAYSWPSWWPARWASSWRLVVPAYEADGTLASLHGRAVLQGADPKTRWPVGASSSELLMADTFGLRLLQGEPLPGGMEAVLLVEGLTGLLNATLRVWEAGLPVAVLAFTSGGPPALARVRWPAGLAAWVATDKDGAGERYAEQVNAALAPQGVRVERVDFGGVGP